MEEFYHQRPFQLSYALHVELLNPRLQQGIVNVVTRCTQICAQHNHVAQAGSLCQNVACYADDVQQQVECRRAVLLFYQLGEDVIQARIGQLLLLIILVALCRVVLKLLAQGGRELQEKVVRQLPDTVGYPRRYTMDHRNLVQLLPFPFGHGFQFFVLAKSTAAQQTHEIPLNDIHYE